MLMAISILTIVGAYVVADKSSATALRRAQFTNVMTSFAEVVKQPGCIVGTSTPTSTTRYCVGAPPANNFPYVYCATNLDYPQYVPAQFSGWTARVTLVEHWNGTNDSSNGPLFNTDGGCVKGAQDQGLQRITLQVQAPSGGDSETLVVLKRDATQDGR